MSTPEKRLLDAMKREQQRLSRNRLESYSPYAKQKAFHAAGAQYRERMFFAGNRCGKTYSGAAELSFHLTGRYPPWWKGRRFNRPINAWACGTTGETTRNIVQAALVGPYDNRAAWGTAALPFDSVDWQKDISMARGVTDLIDTISVRHVSGGRSSLQFKSFDSKRRSFEGTAKDVVWLDELPELDIWLECLARIAPTRKGEASGIQYGTATPVEGMTDTVIRFLSEQSPDRFSITMEIDEAEHISSEERAKIVAGYSDFERECRSKGVPVFGAGRVFLTPESDITVEDFDIPLHYHLIFGADFGQSETHPAAFSLIAHDRDDSDIAYVVKTLRFHSMLFGDMAREVMTCLGGTWARSIPVAYPGDGGVKREQEGELQPIAAIYKAHGLERMIPTREQDGSVSFGASLQRMVERVASGKLKVFRSCAPFFEEYRLYHRGKDGKVAKIRNDTLDSVRNALTMLKSARNDILFNPMSPTGRGGRRGQQKFANGNINRDPYGF